MEPDKLLQIWIIATASIVIFALVIGLIYALRDISYHNNSIREADAEIDKILKGMG